MYIYTHIYIYTLIDWQLYSVHPFRIITLLVIQETQTRITPKWSVQDHSSNRFNIKIQVCISYAHLVSLPLPFHIAHLVHLASDGLAQHIHLGVFWASATDEAILWLQECPLNFRGKILRRRNTFYKSLVFWSRPCHSLLDSV